MTTAVVDKGGQTPNVSQGNNSGITFGQISAGPAALAQLMIYQIMALFAQVIELDQKQKQNSMTAQVKEAQISAQATIDSGQAQMDSLIAQGCFSIGSAAISLGSLYVDRFNKDGQKVTAEVGEADEKLSSMKDMEETMSTIQKRDGQVMADPISQDQDVLDEIQKRKTEFFKEGKFGSLKNGNEDFQKADGSTVLKADGKTTFKNSDIIEEAITQQKGEAGHAQWEEKFTLRLKMSSEDYNSAMQKANMRQTRISTFKEAFSTTLTAASQGIQAKYAADKAGADASTGLANAASQMAGSVSNDQGQAASSAVQFRDGAVQILQKMEDSNSVNG
jgi:hypothetical protein